MPVREQFEVIAPAANREGNFDARQVAALLGWQLDDLARFLERAKSSVYRNPDAAGTQDALGKLVGLYQDMAKLLVPPQGAALSAQAATRAWFRTSIYALDGKSPKDKILAGDIESVRRLVNEYSSGLAF